MRPRMIQLFLINVLRFVEPEVSPSARAPDALLVLDDEPVILAGQSLLPDENEPSCSYH